MTAGERSMDQSNRKTGGTEPVSAQELFPVIKELLAEGRQAAFTVTGMSMWPLLCHGRDQVVLEACDPGQLAVGDILLFRAPPGNYLLHRVTALRPGQFQATGDGNFFRDGWFSNSCVQGRVVRLIREGKHIDCGGGTYRAACRVWMHLFPVRKWLFAGWFRIRKYVRPSA